MHVPETTFNSYKSKKTPLTLLQDMQTKRTKRTHTSCHLGMCHPPSPVPVVIWWRIGCDVRLEMTFRICRGCWGTLNHFNSRYKIVHITRVRSKILNGNDLHTLIGKTCARETFASPKMREIREINFRELTNRKNLGR